MKIIRSASKPNTDNHANQLNPNNDAYRSSREGSKPSTELPGGAAPPSSPSPSPSTGADGGSKQTGGKA